MKGIKSKVRSSAVERAENMYKLTRIIMQHVRPSSRMQDAPRERNSLEIIYL